MNNKFLPQKKVTQSLGFSSLLGLTTLSLLNLAVPVKAASLQCDLAQGICQSGIYYFHATANINVDFNNPNFGPIPINFQAQLEGLSRLLVGTPVDAIVGDPLLGNVGSVDGQLDVIPTEFFTRLSVLNPLNPALHLEAFMGDNIPDLAPSPPESMLPYKSLYSGGAIIKQSTNPVVGDSFLRLFIEVQGTVLGVERNSTPITLQPLSPFTGIIPGQPIQYYTDQEISLLTPGLDGIFWTGDEQFEGARLIPQGATTHSLLLTLTPITVPESSPAFASILVGVAMILMFSKKSGS
ncbi:MAG: hypothetical protein EWV92_05540 [Microcystis aeruginosa Ma_MB_S_20031200_S102]|uniref:PEP-CTERM sorting domain-containing protein n=1 Tax=Microcystis aeruginosa Ma_MB_S_20031200_S102 TaxID=2486254 RepID=A0A552F046_MICAE|nr:MAG: hypothetical protein EWV79_06100 [Microcystis aeruginosa Ma_MB_S_20031200_S102D]TRU40093.1 MAG: hypothetical protein EWV92_05540 [Microcystis aeruginosa Ma_MB_S_20031200_S102]